ncbi:hypothetical protein [uncultured Sphingomonas sp.]|uniref:hypothetical protein n=1 Tax=uncultured Sphingomonas sp. TaxID=158754 RepID=UPI0035CA427A
MKIVAMLLAILGQTAIQPTIELPRPFPPDYLYYTSSGLMSQPRELFIDLKTGATVVASAPNEGTMMLRHRAQASSGELEMFRGLARGMIVAGGELASCQQWRKAHPQDFQLPQMDARAHVSVALAGKYADTPANLSCWTPEANAFGRPMTVFIDRVVGTP